MFLLLNSGHLFFSCASCLLSPPLCAACVQAINKAIEDLALAAADPDSESEDEDLDNGDAAGKPTANLIDNNNY